MYVNPMICNFGQSAKKELLVVDLFFNLEYLRPIFQSVRSHDQLVKHCFSVRFLRVYTVSFQKLSISFVDGY